MLPVLPTRPLWWFARRVVRLLTGFAVAAAFTIGVWAMPAHPGAIEDLGPAGQPTMAGPTWSFEGAPASSVAGGCAAVALPVEMWGPGGDDRPEAGPATTPVSPLPLPPEAAPIIRAAHGQPPAVVTLGPGCARAPPRR
ncbi:hypothetical protein [Micromonospora sp. NPDC047134]|uniref:hypothetical protein n=1 Tax=Micromonospora sp. NPDC047134 TaxID=3154340 RepID=UPI003406BE03